jgi:Alginate export
VKYKSNKWKIDLLAVSPVISTEGVFDDQTLEDFVYGIYATHSIIPQKLLIDYYVLGFTSDRRRYNYVSGKEQRQSFGIRLFSHNKRFNYEIEGTYQTGTFSTQSITSNSISADVNYKISEKNNIILGIAGNDISGDRDRNDNKLNTYNLILSKPSYGLAAPIGSSNVQNINPYLKATFFKKLSLNGGVYFMKRNSIQDGTYSPGMAQLRPNAQKLFESNSYQIGTQYSVEANYIFNEHLAFATDYAFFEAGKYVEETGKGLNISYFSIKSTFKF